MKKYVKENGATISYNYRNEELNRNLCKLGHKVVKDKKKECSKRGCRGTINF